jgi:outer membrane receptor for ferrienterochelin and colicin
VRIDRIVAAFVAGLFVFSAITGARAGSPSMTGVVDDAVSGLPLPGVHVTVEGTALTAMTDDRGAFVLAPVPGVYHLRLEHAGYRTAESASISVRDDVTTQLVLTLSVAAGGSAGVIGRTSTRASDALRQSSTISRTLDADALTAAGYARAGDALRALPGVTNSITGDTGDLDDDLPLEIRGIGATETLTTFDGHPIAFGAQGGFNDQLSPLVGIRDVTVTYGSGSGVNGVDAIGGVIGFRTMDPTVAPHSSFSQGFGTFDRYATTLQWTGTTGHLGYAFAVGETGSDGPIRDAFVYQPSASWDPSATSAAVRDAATYRRDAAASVRTAIGKLSYAFSPQTSLTFTAALADSWEDKTGNGDTDVATAPYELAIAKGKLAAQKASDPCLKPGQTPGAAGNAFEAFNVYGVPYGTGPDGLPDGGSACQTVASYAALNTGPAGAGPASQTIDFNDEHLAFTTGTPAAVFQADAYTNRYLVVQDRSEALPYDPAPGFGKTNAVKYSDYITTGASVSESLSFGSDDLVIGARYLDAADVLAKYGSGGVLSSYGSPNLNEGGLFLHDVYRVAHAPVTVFGDFQLAHASATNATYNDPRLSIVYAPGRNVIRVAAGATTTQPSANLLGQPFVPAITTGAGGGGTLKCGSGVIDSIGTAPSSTLSPERGVDEELSVAHRFWDDSYVQATAYNENVYNKIFSNLLSPLAGAGFTVPSSYLAAATATLDSACGVGNYTVGYTHNANLGLRASGIMIDGRVRVSSRISLDYDYAVTSTMLTAADIQVLRSNPTYIVGAQLPHVPLQTSTVALDGLVGRGLEARYTLHGVGANNTKNLPAYNYSELTLAQRIGHSAITASVFNLFNQDASDVGLENLGVPLALNAFAAASAYAPYVGAAATEQFGLPSRMLSVTYRIDF